MELGYSGESDRRPGEPPKPLVPVGRSDCMMNDGARSTNGRTRPSAPADHSKCMAHRGAGAPGGRTIGPHRPLRLNGARMRPPIRQVKVQNTGVCIPISRRSRLVGPQVHDTRGRRPENTAASPTPCRWRTPTVTTWTAAERSRTVTGLVPCKARGWWRNPITVPCTKIREDSVLGIDAVTYNRMANKKT